MRPIDQNAMDAILRYVNDYYRENHTSPTIRQISEATGVSKSKTQRYVVEMKERGIFEYNRGISSAPKSAKVKTSYISAPVVGSIQCGCPEQEEELVEEYVSLPVSIFGKGDYYILRAKGDSMVDSLMPYGTFEVIYDDGYVFGCGTESGFTTTLAVLGDAIKTLGGCMVPSQVYENTDKPLKIKVILPNASGEAEEFIVSVR